MGGRERDRSLPWYKTVSGIVKGNWEYILYKDVPQGADVYILPFFADLIQPYLHSVGHNTLYDLWAQEIF